MSETREYVVVTDVMGTIGGTQAKGEADYKAAASAAEKLEGAVVETADLTPREARAIDNSPGKVVAPMMPTRLIVPMAKDDGDSWFPSSISNVVPDRTGQPTEAAWGVAATKADGSTFSGAGVTVAILDTGIDRAHAAFAGMINIVEKDFTGTGDGDDNGHGTHCAGTVFGRDCYGYRIGVARGVDRALIGKVMDGDGRGGSSALFDGIYWAISNQADVISMSLGFDFPGFVARLVSEAGLPVDLATSQALVGFRQNLRAFDALMSYAKAQSAMGAGPVVVAATGNESKAQISPRYRVDASLPAAALEVIGIGAASQDGDRYRIAEFSNGSPLVSAPGVDVISASAGGGLESMSGTSMACPHAAGVAALWWEALRQSAGLANAQSVAARLSATARTGVFAADFSRAEFGDGLVTAP
jgi:subtilisin family serine protease